MSILSGYKKVKDRILTSSGYQLLSRWTSSNTVDFDDGKTAQTKVGAINGIIKDKNSLSTVTDDSFAAGAVAVKDAIADVNGKLGNIYISDITSEINTDYVDGSVYVYSTNRTIRVIAKLTAKEDIPAWTHIINNLGWSGINIYFHDVNNQIGINWNGNYMQNTIVVSKNNTFNIDIEGIV